MDENKLNIILNEIRNSIIVNRKYNKISQKDLSMITGIPLKQISAYEKGVRDISLGNFLKIIISTNSLSIINSNLSMLNEEI